MRIKGQTYRFTIFGKILLFLLISALAFGGGTACAAIYSHFFLFDGQAVGGDQDEEVQNVLPTTASGQEISSSSPDESLLVLVNKTNPVQEAYKPDKLVRVSDYVPGKDEAYSYARPELADAFDRLLVGAKKEELEIIASNAYRSYAVQKATFEDNVRIKGSVEAANQTSAKPGESEHQTGLAMDLTTKSLDYVVSARFAETPEGKWIREHCHEYGFIIRFPEGKEHITGYSYEPWHIRYVGEVAAKTIYERGWTLEEYLDNKKTSDNI